MKTSVLPFFFLSLLFISGCCRPKQKTDDIWNLAVSRASDLRLGVYVTAQTVQKQFTTEEGRREAVSLLRCNGITKVYVEIYRSGLVVSPEVLKNSVSFLEKNGFEVVGGIATVPGKGFGVHQEGKLRWFNWQDKKTQNDVRHVMETAAPIFKKFITDDFFCTADTSLQSKLAKGNRSWSEYRRSLMDSLAESVMIKPAKAKNPALQVIIKYPQWYDRFHLFGYDVAIEPKLFDGVWVGTETRGQYTQRYGFVQPYEGFINYRWISTLAGPKIGGAWFDHGDCTARDFIDQAYQSVLAGAKELVIFNFSSFLTGHPGHHLLRLDFEKLANLAKAVAQNPVTGPVGYKPANSDAGGDLYIMDYVGMWGISLIPDSKYPENAKVVFLPTQAAKDTAIVEKVIRSLEKGTKIIMTTGFIDHVANGRKLADLAGIKWPLDRLQRISESVLDGNHSEKIKFPLTTDYQLVPEGAEVLLQTAGQQKTPFLIQGKNKNIFVLNTHTFSQKDFDAVGEVLLCPRQIGLPELPESWVNTIRKTFRSPDEPELTAPSRVCMQQLSNHEFILQNYNQDSTSIKLIVPVKGKYINRLTGDIISTSGNEIKLKMAPRSRSWLKMKI